MNQDSIVCDKCSNYSVSPGGCTESCAINLSEPFILRDYYFEERRDEIKSFCKEFKRLQKER
jgi:hypothetical protein